jgi:hypothetical protein
MHRGIVIISCQLFLSFCLISQEIPDTVTGDNSHMLSGFIRGGFYADLKDNPGKPFISSGFADFGLKAEARLQGGFQAAGDIRMRYGSEFTKAVSEIMIREAFAEYSGNRFSISAGKRIIKWGRADFTNPVSKLNPQNYISRSPDREDMDLGNILATVSLFPFRWTSVQAVVIPFYSPSVLIIDPFPLPEYVTISKSARMVTEQELISYGLRAGFNMRGVDFSLTWFEGYDPMPGIELRDFTADFSGPLPVISAALGETPWKTRLAGADFETAIGGFGFRGEAAWSVPLKSWEEYEYVPLPEIKWVAGTDFSAGILRFTAEYSGKAVTGFSPSPVNPILGTEPDFEKLAGLMATPGFDLNEYIRQQTGAFNRLYNYQLERYYHSAGLRIEADMAYGKLFPSIFGMYNFTSRDLLLLPEVKFKPYDGLTLVAGAEIYSGRNSSLFDLVDEFMTSIYIGIKADF